MGRRLHTHQKNTKIPTPEPSTAPAQGMFQPRPFGKPAATADVYQQPDLKTSLVQAERYGHHLSQMHDTDVSPPQVTQLKRGKGRSMPSEPASQVSSKPVQASSGGSPQPIQLASSDYSSDDEPAQVVTAGPRRSSTGRASRAQSPGGSTYRRRSPSGSHRRSTRRRAAGYENPAHMHPAMRPHWRDAAVSPPPPGLRGRAEREYYEDPSRRYREISPNGTEYRFTGHSGGVLGHGESAGANWNRVGNTRSRRDNLAYNRQTSSYHGIEERGRSDASGHREQRYASPRPDLGSNRQFWDRDHPNFNSQGGGPWHSWEREASPAPPTNDRRADGRRRRRRRRAHRRRQQPSLCNVM